MTRCSVFGSARVEGALPAPALLEIGRHQSRPFSSHVRLLVEGLSPRARAVFEFKSRATPYRFRRSCDILKPRQRRHNCVMTSADEVKQLSRTRLAGYCLIRSIDIPITGLEYCCFRLMMELEGGHRNSVIKRRNPIEFGLV
ncbi:hypothetical protein EVAR_93230_1 [Eumeta japonica]|uniref:Uncharacterized protein n=1 Tax=Eumeta variegata TaxID=151549 RepID=A0A4C1TXM9_EUMVA|nr:hypothetical protein EVAR_93230_1 [Eumeta japonica]